MRCQKDESLLKNQPAAVEVTLSAGRALAAALVLVELNQAGDGSNNISLQTNGTTTLLNSFMTLGGFDLLQREETHRFVHDYECSCTQAGLSLDEAVEVHHHLLTHILGNERCGGATGDDG